MVGPTRLPDLEPTALARARVAVPARRLVDLTVTNPTAVGLDYPDDLLAPLADPRGLHYRPDPRGPIAGRRAVADWYRTQGRVVEPDQVILTASTSEAYSLLFKALAQPGEEVLLPAPSYPLFEHLARAEGLGWRTLDLLPEAGWTPDDVAVARAPERVKAVVVVHPNNPTGSALRGPARDALLAACAARGLPLIVDEVFLPYPLGAGTAGLESLAGSGPGTVVCLGGLSKSVGLPQLKLSWMVVSGDDVRAVHRLLERLEFLADLSLSVATPTGEALAELLAAGQVVRDRIRDRCRTNLHHLQSELGARPDLELLMPDGGWSACLRFPAIWDEQEVCLALIEGGGVVAQPGYYFDFPSPGWLVVSLLTPPETFQAGLGVILRTLQKP